MIHPMNELHHNGYCILLEDEGCGDWNATLHAPGGILVGAWGYAFGGPHMTRQTALACAMECAAGGI